MNRDVFLFHIVTYSSFHVCVNLSVALLDQRNDSFALFSSGSGILRFNTERKKRETMGLVAKTVF